MGCLFSKKKELAESQDKGKSPNKDPKEGNSNRGNLYIEPEKGGSKSPRPQLPSPYQHAVIDPSKKSQLSKYEHGDEIVNEETHVLEGKTFAPALHELNLQVALA